MHARSELGLDDAAFVLVAERPAHEGLLKIPGQPLAGRPAILRARVAREDVTDATFDLVSMSGARVQAIELSPVTASGTEEESVGEIANRPGIPFRVRVSGRRTPVTVSTRSVGAPARLQIVAVLNATVLRVEPATIQLSANQSHDVTVWVDVPADGTSPSGDIVVTAESPTDPAAANSALIQATLLDAVR